MEKYREAFKEIVIEAQLERMQLEAHLKLMSKMAHLKALDD